MKSFFAVLLLTLPLPAASIVNGGLLLNQTDANQLATWLGPGDLTFTNIFSSAPVAGGAAAFHAAADSQGATFSLIQTNLGLVGGYDPLPWDSSGSYNIQNSTTGRDAFIFNLSTPTMLAQRLDFAGKVQTYNNSSFGPTFGGGFDLTVYSSDLSRGSSYGGIGQPNMFGASTLKLFTVSRVETFTFAQASAATPEPATSLLCGGALLALGALRKRRLS